MYTMTRTYNLISTTMPPGMEVAGAFALAGLDGGLIGWLLFSTRGAAPGPQRTIANLMIMVCLAGVTASVVGDTFLIYDPTTKETIGTISIWVTIFVIMANVAGFIGVELTAPEQALRDAEHSMMHELERQRAQHIQDNAAQLSAEAAKAQANAYIKEVLARFQGTNGNGNGNSETATYQKDGDDSAELRQAEALAERDAKLINAAIKAYDPEGKALRPRSRAS